MRKQGAVLCLALLLTGCGAAAARTEPAVPTPEPAAVTQQDPAAALLETMTLRQKVGQLFLVRPDALDLTQTQEQRDDPYAAGVTEVTDALRETLRQYPVGGVCLFGKNITDPQQVMRFNADWQAASDTPLWIAVDEEGGAVARLANHPAFDLPAYESAAAVGASGDTAAAETMGRTIGAYLKEYGFNLDFAPVADVNTNPGNPIIGDRAFSSDAQAAAALAEAMAQGLCGEGILPTLKHFPGHGDTAEDSHLGLAVTGRSLEEMRSCEWLPFQRAVGRPYAVMVGHIAAPQVTGDSVPASFSETMVTGILRGELGYEGLVITDSLSMRAVTDAFGPGEAAVAALRAGCDILLMPADLPAAFESVLAAVEQGSLTEQRIDESVYRILAWKAQYGLLP